MSGTKVEYAKGISDIKRALRPQPLSLDELEEFFEETADARNENLSRRDELYQFLQAGDNSKILVVGHAGAGKSTELVKFQQEHQAEFAFVSFNLVKEAQLSQADVESILLLIVENVTRAVKEQLGVELNEKTLESISNWFAEIYNITEKDLQYTGQVGAGVDAGQGFLSRLLGLSATLKADVRTGSLSRRETRLKEEHRLSGLAYQCNLLIKEARIAIWEKLKKDFVVIVEDSDKLPIDRAEKIFLRDPAPLADLDCKAIYTFPIWLLSNPRTGILDALFNRLTIPMIKVRNQDGSPFNEGREAIKAILWRRMDQNLIAPDALELAIDMTGGVLRHLFEVLILASLTANQAIERGRAEQKMLKQDVRYGLNQKRIDLIKRIGVFGLPDEYKGITVEQLYDGLNQLKDNPRNLESDRINVLLLQAHAIIEYNGEGWHSVHPLIAEYLEDRPQKS